METLFFVGIVLLFSILDAIGRKQRKEAQRKGEGQAREPRLPESRGARPEYTRAGGTVQGDEASASSSSEGLIPSDLWEEITALARGDVPASRAPKPVEERPRPQRRVPTRTGAPPRRQRPRRPEPSPSAAPRRAEAPTTSSRTTPGERIHALHPEMGHDMAERLTRLDRPADHRPHPNPDAGKALRMLKGDNASLRQALILREILGPPLALRDEEDGPAG